MPFISAPKGEHGATLIVLFIPQCELIGWIERSHAPSQEAPDLIAC